MKDIFSCANILLPKDVDMNAWSVVACDQHTSDEKYWQDVYDLVGNKPSTLNLIVPEVYLGRNDEALIERTNNNMVSVVKSGIFKELKDSLIYVERELANGKIRKGLIGKIDLEEYSVNMADNTPIKPSEEIVESRVPIRVKIRKNASLDFPHILLFCDDKEKQIIEPLANVLSDRDKVYDFNLNMNGGQIRGYKISGKKAINLANKVNALMQGGETGLIVADGNHSLVAAKRVYEAVKTTDSNYLNSPKRYALVEVVNIYDDAIDIEPIHRVIKNVNCSNLKDYMMSNLPILKNGIEKNMVKIMYKGFEQTVTLATKENQLAVEIVQQLLDKYLKEHNCTIDYIHEADKLEKMCEENGVMAIEFAPIVKEDIFEVVNNKKLFPRKTFSIGTSLDKRYYLESRKLTK